ncbi:Xylose isomerase-like TIM barrel [Thalassoglobus neptunius]|uniref:Xylose isomerase-like TIM barrel n=1 Tax=Thalassoglobus neptunius TaxID=1938619 RepID=A0A5C5VPQ1_9PLAN|nr:sugar phosphate isomerase/epimerase [Thalassoglobus neptunius]TWT40618.1 Xylose isomerase-like TIM barrel [Thalassoglobus neptunius]
MNRNIKTNESNPDLSRAPTMRNLQHAVFSRREALVIASAACLTNSFALPAHGDAADSGNGSVGCTLGFSTYGMPSIKSERAIDLLDEIGFDSVEISVRAGADADAATLTGDRRRKIRMRLASSGIKLTSLMEHVRPSSDKRQKYALERLRLAAELANNLSPDSPPLIQTVLGGGRFSEARERLRDYLGQWSQLAQESNVIIAIKPHRGGVVSKPAEAIWLFKQLGKPKHLRMVYDFSHYAFRGMTLEKTAEESLPYVAHVAVKDAVQNDDRVSFLLPGEAGTIDFAKLIARLHAGGYRGDINCEVSSMVSRRDNYDALAAARLCYRNLSKAFERSGVRRPR